MVTVSAPGKIHLMGEHAVVYGKPALLSAIGQRLSVSITPGKRGVTIQTVEEQSYVRHALSVVQKKYKISKLPPMVVTVASSIPAGYHLGSSAAVAVATIGAAVYFLKKLWNPTVINQLAYEVEKKQHGNPSGGDNTIVTVGGFIWFRKEFEFLKSIWQLPFRFPQSLNHFFLVNTGKPAETTGEMVAYVKSKVKSQKSKMENVFDQNEQEAKKITLAIKEANETLVIDAMKKGERTLEEMGVVSSVVIPLIRTIEKAGGAAKILGGGGRRGPVGFLLAYHRDPHVLASQCAKFNYTTEPVKLGEDGVKLESK